MTQTPIAIQPLQITWELLPYDFILPDDPVDNLAQPLLAAVLREILEIYGFIKPEMIIATNFGICAKIEGKIVVKAPDWVYIPQVIPTEKTRRSYTPYVEGDIPLIVMEFISETEGGEYSVNPHYPYGKWYFYERILQVPIYAIFQPEMGLLEVYQLNQGHYEGQKPDERGLYEIAQMGLFLGVWQGNKAENFGYWLRWWDQEGKLLPWAVEKIEQERQRAEVAKQEYQRAEQERQRAEAAEQELAKLRELLQKANISPDALDSDQ